MADEQSICTCTVTNGDATVTSSAQTWLTTIDVNDVFKKNTDSSPTYHVASITNDNSLELTSAYAGSTETVECVFHRSFTANLHLARPMAGDEGIAEILTNEVIDILDDSVLSTDTSVTWANGAYIAVDEIRARDADGLKLYDDSGAAGINIADAGEVTLTHGLTVTGTLDLDGNAITAAGALTVTPGAGTNLNVTLSTTGDFAVNTDDLYVDTSSGNVGIGTTGPQAKLHISASVAGEAELLRLENLSTNASESEAITFYGNTSLQQRAKISVIRTAGGSGGIMRFYTQRGVGSLTEKVRIDENGNVGIGTIVPQQKLTLASASNFATEMAAPGAPSGTPSGTGGSMATGTYYYVITALDGVGETVKGTESAAVAVTGPTGSVALSWTAVTGAASYKVYRTTTSGTYTTPALIANPTTNSQTDTLLTPTAGAPPSVTTAYVNKLTASGNSWLLGGNVGIGTTVPNQKLTIEGTMSLKEQADAAADTAAYGQIWVHDTAPNELWFTDDAGTDTQISPHPLDAPSELYKAGPGIDWIDKRVQKYLGVIFWTPNGGETIEETFAEYNKRMKDELGFVKLEKRDWEEDNKEKEIRRLLNEDIEIEEDEAYEDVDIEVEEEIEIEKKEALEKVPVMKIESVEAGTKTQYKFNSETGKIEKVESIVYESMETETDEYMWKIRGGVRFDTDMGKFYEKKKMAKKEKKLISGCRKDEETEKIYRKRTREEVEKEVKSSKLEEMPKWIKEKTKELKK